MEDTGWRYEGYAAQVECVDTRENNISSTIEQTQVAHHHILKEVWYSRRTRLLVAGHKESRHSRLLEGYDEE